MALFCLACEADVSGLRVLGVDELAALRAGDEALTICDANNADVRQRYGTIPGAVLLSSYRDYDAAVELPPDKAQRVVFYCRSEMCGAAGDAARRATAHGHTNVWVMHAGIKGWVEAEQPVVRGAS
jgi:rhodanese-related sulfurtransferase